jgi:hypothetical protein
MLSKINPTETSAWEKLTAHYTVMKSVKMKTLFAKDGVNLES